MNTDIACECGMGFALCHTSHIHVVAYFCDVLDVPGKKHG